VPSLLTAIRDELVAHDIVRRPSVAGDQPPMWLEPALNTPAPGEGKNPVEIGADVVIGAFLTGGFAPAPYAVLRKPIVDLRIRAAKDKAYLAEEIELAITGRLIDRRDWMMGGLYIVESQQWRPLQRLGSGPQGHEYVVAFWFELIRA
jgi:hypothetical protein